MNIYIGDYWEPFPSSEYGGTWVVIAENNGQVIDLLKGLCYDEDYYDMIPETVSKAKVFPLDKNQSFQPQIVDYFFT